MRIGEEIEIRIERLLEEGLFAESGSDLCFVPRTELFWRWPADLSEAESMRAYGVGSMHRAIVTGYMPDICRWLVSIRRVAKELNPYTTLRVGDVLSGMVARKAFPGIHASKTLVKSGDIVIDINTESISKNAVDMLELSIGSRVEIVVTHVSIEEPRAEGHIIKIHDPYM